MVVKKEEEPRTDEIVVYAISIIHSQVSFLRHNSSKKHLENIQRK